MPSRASVLLWPAITCASLTMVGCGGGSGGPPQYTVGGAVAGLAPGTSVVLSDNGQESVTVNSNSGFTFPTSLTSGSAYAITVRTQPQSQTCTVANGSGTIASSNVTSITVTCVASYTVGGTVHGLAPGVHLVLLNNGGDPTTVSSNVAFTFPTGLSEADAYSVSVGTQPAGQMCTVNYPKGVINLSITNVLVECATEAVLWSFGADKDGVNPWGGLIFGSDGALYGSTSNGGTFGGGTIYRVTLDGHESVLWNFGAGSDGASPFGALLVGSDGNFYGTTSAGGTKGTGTVFRLTPSGTETILWNFGTNPNDGLNPRAGLTLGNDGNFYGTTLNGGAAGYGTVFRITPTGAETVLWSFWVTVGDVNQPWAPLILASDGNFYGTGSGGGLGDWGTAFKITSAGEETVLWSFIPGANLGDGISPVAPLVEGADGYLYGTTYLGGNGYTDIHLVGNGSGAVVRLAKEGADVVGYGSEESVFWRFGASGPEDGGSPQAGLMIGRDGNFYGTTSYGGAHMLGTVFELTPSGVESVLWNFGTGTDASNIQAPLLQGPDGSFYGVSVTGGVNGAGALFRLAQ